MAILGIKKIGYPKTPSFVDKDDESSDDDVRIARVVQNLVFSPKGETVRQKCGRQLFHAMQQANLDIPNFHEEPKAEEHVEILTQTRESVGMAATQGFENFMIDFFETQGQIVQVYGFITQSDAESFKQLLQEELDCAFDLEAQTIVDCLTKVVVSIPKMQTFVGALKIDGMIYFFNMGELKAMLVSKRFVEARELNYKHLLKIQNDKISLFACYTAYNSEISFIKDLHADFMRDLHSRLSEIESLDSALKVLEERVHSLEERIKEKGITLEICAFSKKRSHFFKATDAGKIYSDDCEDVKQEYSIYQVTKQVKRPSLRPKITYIKSESEKIFDLENHQAALGYQEGDYLIFASEALWTTLPDRGILSMIQKMDSEGLLLEEMAKTLIHGARKASTKDVSAMVVKLS